ncbi:MAG: GNAT family N-acetyltransferase [Bacteroidota bacterium]
MRQLHLTNEVSLSPITPNDASVVLDLMVKLYTSAYDYLWTDSGYHYAKTTFSRDALMKDLDSSNTSYDFIDVDGVHQGMLRMCWNQSFAGLNSLKPAKLHRIYLTKAVRGRQIGPLLMDYISETARSGGNTCLWLEAMTISTKVVQFYEHHGYQIHSHIQLDLPYIKPESAGMVRMVKEL